MKQRIQTLDGLRFLAAIGVLWIHTWTFYKNPRFYIGKIDIADVFAIGVNGVNLFFVISGFCMYYFYASKGIFSYHDFYRFITKRWWRLSPAFYVSTIIYMLVLSLFYNFHFDFVRNLLHSIFYLNDILPQYNTSSHFWTLTVEWQFYFIIPFLMIYQNKIGFKRIFLLIFGFLFVGAIISVLILKSLTDMQTFTILFHSVEFGFGVLAARLLIKDNSFFKNRISWLAAFILITYTGRVLTSSPILSLSTNYYNIFRLFGFTFMGLGFAGILYLSVTSVGWLNLILGNRLFKSIGKVSYSFYLLHGLVIPVIAGYVIADMPFFTGIMAPIVTTCISAFILYPICTLNYMLLEKPFLTIGKSVTK